MCKIVVALLDIIQLLTPRIYPFALDEIRISCSLQSGREDEHRNEARQISHTKIGQRIPDCR
jgi:hypothetical protein